MGFFKELSGDLRGVAINELLELFFPQFFDRGRLKNKGESKDGKDVEKAGVGGFGLKDELFNELAENLAKNDPSGPKVTAEELNIIYSAIDSLGKPSYKRTLLQIVGHQAVSRDDEKSIAAGKSLPNGLENIEGAKVLSNLAEEIRNACNGKKFDKKVKPTKTELVKAQTAVISHLFHRGILRNREEEIAEVVQLFEKGANALLDKLGWNGPEADKWLKDKNDEYRQKLEDAKKVNQKRALKRPKLWQVATACAVVVAVVCIIF